VELVLDCGSDVVGLLSDVPHRSLQLYGLSMVMNVFPLLRTPLSLSLLIYFQHMYSTLTTRLWYYVAW